MKKRVAVITWAGLPQGAESEQLLLPLLAASRLDARMVDWRNASVDFSTFDLIVLRSCWDYHLHAQEFAEWLKSTARAAPVLNQLDTVLWNSNKFYLRELGAQGIQIAPTCFVSGREQMNDRDLAQTQSWVKVVAKPAVSASAYRTRVFERRNLPLPEELSDLMDGKDFLLQQFIPEIQTQGELSFIYIDGVYSHAVCKRPAHGDFRVQQEHGGSAELFCPSAALLRQANQIAQAVPQVRGALYCRLDAVEQDGKLILMELELIEPELYLGLAEGSSERLAAEIARKLR